MERFKNDYIKNQGERLSFFRLTLGGLILLVAYLLTGCAAYTALPVTLQELKHYVVEQEESYPQPLRAVVRAATCTLKELEFKIERIEVGDHQAYMTAGWGETHVRLEFVEITPTFTRIESRMIKENNWRDYASEKELFLTVRRILDGEKEAPNCWSRAVRGMVPLSSRPESGAAIIAYLSPDFSIELNERESRPPRWAAIALKLGGFAYLDQRRYSLKTNFSKKPVLPENSFNEQFSG